MNYLLCGPDTYRSRKKLNEIVGAFIARAGAAASVHRFDAEEGDIYTLKNVLETDSLFAAKKIVVAEYAVSGTEDFEPFAELAEKNAARKDSILIFWDRNLASADEKKRLLELEPHCEKTQEFTVLEGEALRRWIAEEAKKRNVSLSPGTTAQLVSYGGDLWRVSNELDKLSLAVSAAGKAAISETNIFLLGDTFFGDRRGALKNLLHHLENSEDDFGAFSYLANHTRTLLTIKSYSEQNKPVSPAHKIHPFVAKKASGIVRALSQGTLASVFRRFFDEDHKIKTGLSRPGESLVRIRIG